MTFFIRWVTSHTISCEFGISLVFPQPDYCFSSFRLEKKRTDNLIFRSESNPLNFSSPLIPSFKPIPELQSQDSDVTIVGLMNRMSYRTPINDALYRAQNCTSNDASKPNPTVCTATHLISFVGCKESYQICTKDEAHCSPLTGLHLIQANSSEFADLNSEQKTVFKLLWEMMYFLQLNYQSFLIGPEFLVANDYRWSARAFISAALPENQWHMEVANWMNTTLAGMQRQTLSYARPPNFDFEAGVITTSKHMVAPANEVERAFCQKMKARSRAHASFSIIRFLVIIVVGLVIIIVNLSLGKVTAAIQVRTGKGLYKRLDWIETSAFQLQRMAAEGRGVGPWAGRQQAVPRLVERGFLFSLTGESIEGVWNDGVGYKTIVQGSSEDVGGERDVEEAEVKL